MHHSRLHREKKGINVMFILQNNCKMLNMWFVSLLQSLGGRIAHRSQFFLSVCLEKAGAAFSTWKREMSNKELRKLLQSILLQHRARCDCFTRNPTHLALQDLKQIICICSLSLVGLVWEQLKLKIKQLEFLWSSYLFFVSSSSSNVSQCCPWLWLCLLAEPSSHIICMP